MKIKTLRVKVENDNQEFDFRDFFTGNNIIHNIIANIVKEKDGYYWYALITYEEKNSFGLTEKVKEFVPYKFIYEINELIEKYPPKKTTTKNIIKGNEEQIYHFVSIQDFYRLRNFGKILMENDKDFLSKVIEIVRKYHH